MAGLLPKDNAEFSSKSYWEDFFRKRGQDAFEWYGNFSEIFPLLKPASDGSKVDRKVDYDNLQLKETSNILVIGCGNSNFSSDLYDNGFRSITNLDFSELVISEMQCKNISRPEMNWVVGDMTNMSNFSNNQFDVIIDKGALDALMSENTVQLKEHALNMFAEIERLLCNGGTYICISLLEDYILSVLLQYFQSTKQSEDSSSWLMTLRTIRTSRPSPFIPFLLALTLDNKHSQSTIKSFVDQLGNCLPDPKAMTSFSLTDSVKYMQEFHQLRFRIAKLEVGRFETIHLWSPEHSVPRFTLFILDAGDSQALSCAVFLIPFGRESDYQFTTLDGLLDIAYQAKCKRLIAVSCNKPHSFPSMEELQNELSPIILSLCLDSMDLSEKIPYMAIGGDNSWEIIAEGSSATSGSYIVEEKEEDEGKPYVYRRLIFLQNQQFVQSEARLIMRKSAVSSGSAASKKRNKKKKSSSAGATGDVIASDYRLDTEYLDDLYKAIIASLTLNSSIISVGSAKDAPGGDISGLLVGLGGGSLVMSLQRLLPRTSLDVCELDGEVCTIASKYFEFKPEQLTRVHIGDGLEFCRELAVESSSTSSFSSSSSSVSFRLLYDYIIIDADSKDASLGLSAPPKEFITSDILLMLHRILKPGGLLIFNVVARSKSKLSELESRLKTLFPADAAERNKCFRLQPSSDIVNVILVSAKLTSREEIKPKEGKKGSKGAPSISAACLKTLNLWLKNCSEEEDPLRLEEFIDRLQEF